MRKIVNNDWYTEFKLEVIELVSFFYLVKIEFITMIITNSWILDDVNLSESYNRLFEIIKASNENMDELVSKVKKIDLDSIVFDVIDLRDEFDYVKENIYLESSYMTNMINQMIINEDYTLDYELCCQKLFEIKEQDYVLYNQMKINNENLKQLKKERRNYNE